MRRERSGHKSAPRQLVDEVQYRGTNIINRIGFVRQTHLVTEIRNMALPCACYSRATVDVGMYVRRLVG